MVGAFQYIEVVFDDEHCVSALDKLVDDAEKHVYVLKVQSGRRFVRMNSVFPVSLFDSSVASFTRWFSPPDSVLEGCPSLM